ncbi:carbohydrate ABC transporter permease [Faecalicatena contorta]|uniref:Carbohydrate ABC transporter membrane protein 1, CUT1 family n=1 Tax=Faecalicatena contorta TaxID=39482 RepID=A0A316AKF5_9FIRM|nr:sugar ABC transporter permease [Faecalicatena contorta]PWJ50487.1 carbohydrate ABC transporter membrane protein 1 (CUT1 family) [Faecalicatena contorta]SUQ13895.1 carbohydrate ABC transporter membrane protein 1, CUT1 family [Faecalicatena contorta]
MYKSKGKIIVVFLLPSLLGLLVFKIGSMLYSLYISFTDWNLFGTPNFVGFDNYIEIFKNERFYLSLKNTLYFIVGYLPLVVILSLGIAMLLNTKVKKVTVYRGLFFLPVITSWVAVSMIWKGLLNPEFGVINAIIRLFGGTGPAWLQDPGFVMPAIIMTSVWKDVGFLAIIFLGGLQGISRSYYEAAEIDCASKWQQFKSITLPLLSPTTFYALIITIINSFQVFDQIWVMTSGEPTANLVPVMVTEIYKNSFDYQKMGYATALSWVLFGIIIVVTIFQNVMQKKWVHYE